MKPYSVFLVFQAFAEQYVACNPSSEQGAVDAILILAFAIVMLNTDLHSPNVKRRMTEVDFINNLKGTVVQVNHLVILGGSDFFIKINFE